MQILLYQGEVLTQEALQLFAQQQLATQLAIVLLAVTIVSGIGLAGFFRLLGSFSTIIEQLKKSMDRQTDMLRDLLTGIENRIEHVEIDGELRDTQIRVITGEIRSGFTELNGKLDRIATILEENPKGHKDLLDSFLRLERTLQQTKIQTDQLEDFDKVK